MYFESVFIKPNNFSINIYNINLQKKLIKIQNSLFLALRWIAPLIGKF